MMMKTAIAVLTLALLSACSMFSPVKTEPSTTYMISTVPIGKTAKPRLPINLLVTAPQANSIYNTSSIAYSTHLYEIAYFAKNRWIEPPTQMLYPLIIKTLENTHRFRHVSSYSNYGSYDFTLNTYLVKLQEDYSHYPYSVNFILKAEIINNHNNKIIATQEFSVNEPLRQNTPYSGVIATNQATAILLQQLAQFCVNKIRP